MRSITCWTRACMVAALLPLTGCQKVNEQKTVSLNPGDVVAPLIIEGPSRAQDVTVIVSTQGAPVDVFIALESEALDNGAPRIPKKSLAKELKVEGEKALKAQIPAKSSYAIVVGNAAKTTTVSIKLQGK